VQASALTGSCCTALADVLEALSPVPPEPALTAGAPQCRDSDRQPGCHAVLAESSLATSLEVISCPPLWSCACSSPRRLVAMDRHLASLSRLASLSQFGAVAGHAGAAVCSGAVGASHMCTCTCRIDASTLAMDAFGLVGRPATMTAILKRLGCTDRGSNSSCAALSSIAAAVPGKTQ
jgi:hypothetical protein